MLTLFNMECISGYRLDARAHYANTLTPTFSKNEEDKVKSSLIQITSTLEGWKEQMGRKSGQVKSDGVKWKRHKRKESWYDI